MSANATISRRPNRTLQSTSGFLFEQSCFFTLVPPAGTVSIRLFVWPLFVYTLRCHQSSCRRRRRSTPKNEKSARRLPPCRPACRRRCMRRRFAVTSQCRRLRARWMRLVSHRAPLGREKPTTSGVSHSSAHAAPERHIVNGHRLVRSRSEERGTQRNQRKQQNRFFFFLIFF